MSRLDWRRSSSGSVTPDGRWRITRMAYCYPPVYVITEYPATARVHPPFQTLAAAKAYVARLNAPPVAPPVAMPPDDPRPSSTTGGPTPMRRVTVHDDRLIVHAASGDYTVALRDGQLPVRVYDQSCNPWDRGEQLISVDAAADPSPRWGQGWTVLDTSGTEQWFASNWDSSG